jgi:hypothetical protein
VAATTASVIPCPTAPVACDTFNRSVSNGWGSADVGGAWDASSSQFAVTPGAGTIAGDSTAPATFLTTVSAQDVDLRALISPPALNASVYQAQGVAFRVASGSYYMVDTYYGPSTPDYTVEVQHKPDGVLIQTGEQTSVPGGTPYWLRVEAVGVSPTTIRWKLWDSASAEPATWSGTATDATAAQQAPGAVGVVAYASSGTSMVAFNSLQVVTPPPPTIVPCPTSPVACDSFNRSAGGGWGSADVGGAWDGTGSAFAVTPGAGTITADSTAPATFLTSVSAQDVDLRALISPPAYSSTQTQEQGVEVRVASGSSYMVGAYYGFGATNYMVELKHKPDNVAILPDLATSVPGGTPYWVRFEALGVSPTTLRWKLWASGTAEPASWTETTTDSTAAQQAAGAIGVVAYASSGTSTVAFNSLQVVAPPPPTIIPCPTSPVACDTFNRSASNGWGSADVGGSWNATGSQFAVSPGAGTIAADSTTPSAFLASVSVQDVDLRVLITPPAINATQTQAEGAAVRFAAGTGSYYMVDAYYVTGSNGGNYTVQLKRKPDNVNIRPEFPTSVPGGSPYWLRIQAQGVVPTTLRWKLWAANATEPAAWTDTGVDANPAQQAAGGVGVVGFATSGVSVVAFNSVQATAMPVTPPTIIPCPSGVFACDSFNRSVSNGWGTADIGGAWNTSGSKFAMTPGRAVVIADPSTPSNFLTSVTTRDVDMRALISPPPISQQTNDDGIAIRYVAATGTWYQLNAYYFSGSNNGNYTVQLKRKPEDTSIRPDFPTTVPGGDPYWLRLQATGVNPTTLRWKIWANGSTEPSAWTDTGTDSTAADQSTGAVGVVAYTFSGTSAVAFNSVQATAIPVVPPTIIPCPSGTLVCDTFNRTVHNGWGTADSGGAWTKSGTAYQVSPGSAALQVNNTAPDNFLTSVSIQDVDARLAVSMPALSVTGDAGVLVRYSANGGTFYQVSMYATNGVNGNDYIVQLKRKPENVLINPDFRTSIPAGTPVWLRVQAQGVNPTTLRWKIWRQGSSEPSAWTATGTDSHAAEQRAGGIGAEGYVFSGSATIDFNNISASAIGSGSGGALVNGGFEAGNLSGWQASGAAVSVVGSGHTGSYAARLGSTAATNGDSTITQTVTVPAAGATLSWWYQPHCPDTLKYDWERVEVRTTGGALLTTLLNVCSNSRTWTFSSHSMSAYRGQTVVLKFINHDDNYPTDPTYTLFDDVALF